MTSPRNRSLALALVALAAVPAAAALTGCGTASSSAQTPYTPPSTLTTDTAAKAAAAADPTTGPVKVGLGEWNVTPSATSAKAGKVTFDVTNAGKVKHEFVVLRTSKGAGALGGGTRVSEAGNVGETGDVAAGKSKSVTLSLKPGHYAFVCNLPGHYAAGMHADFTVG